MHDTIPSILLKGLDGSNPLAFLAALGTLRTLTMALPDERVRMSWEQTDGSWRPRVWGSLAGDVDALIERLDELLVNDRSSHETSFLDKDKDATAARTAQLFATAREGKLKLPAIDSWLVALANDLHPNATSPFQLTRRDYLPGNLDQILANTTSVHLRKALFATWKYDDQLDNQSLHIEPSEDRRHAYQWNKPSGDPNKKKRGNMLGANRLAIESMPIFIGLPSHNPDRLFATGWTGVRSDDSRWTWPIWEVACSLNVIRSVLSLRQLQQDAVDMQSLSGTGIKRAYRCRRILVEQTPNLTPSVAIA